MFAPPLPPSASFLATCARYLLETYGAGPFDALADVIVVVPTRRAVVYLKNELALALPNGQGLWAPRITTMEDYVVDFAGVQIEEPIALQLLLFDLLKGVDTALDFDKFVGWAGLLLNDFSALDQNLAHPHTVFDYLSEAKALERWNLEAVAENGAARRAFGFWNNLEQVYQRLQTHLLARHLAYPGLAYRRAVERLQTQLKADGPRPPRHVFLGLGQLSGAEETLIGLLLGAGCAEVRLDADPFYLDPASPNRAGLHLKKYAGRWHLPLAALGDGHEHLRGRPRHVRALGVANPSQQGKLAGQLLAEARAQYPGASVAVVLPDETMLLPVLYGLPASVPEFNVTMGLSFQATPLFNLIDLLFEVHLTGIRPGAAGTGYDVVRYHHLAVSKLLAHPFLRRYQHWLDQQPTEARHHGLFDSICRAIVKQQAVLLDEEQLRELGGHHPLVEALFATWHNGHDVLRACHTLIDVLRQVYAAEKASSGGSAGFQPAQEGTGPEREIAFGAEYLYLFYTLVKRLESAFETRQPPLSVPSFRRFLYEQMNRTRLPFEGEPLAEVQIMGLLETRALDFDHVIILSCNENVLPARRSQQSLFPFDVLSAARMPTHADAEADAAYNFWRLLHRAQRADLLYVLPGADGSKTGERSRFLLQLEHDLLPQAPHLVLENLTVAAAETAPPAAYAGDIVLEKDDAMLAALRGILSRNISPSRLNDYLTCSLRFYFNKVARFHENEAVEETLEASSFGTMVHEALEMLFTPFLAEGRAITAADIPALVAAAPAEVERALRREEADRHARADHGLNHVYGQVATRLVVRLLESLEAQPAMLPLTLFGLETELAATVFVQEPGQPAPLAVRLTGFADRVDELPDGRLRVVDYKSGLVTRAELQLSGGPRKRYTPAEATERLLTEASPAAAKVRQLWLYRLMLAHTRPARPTADTAILSLRNLPEGLLSANLDFLTEASGTDFRSTSDELLRQLVLRILDPTEPIRKTDDFAHCEYCDYRGICAR